MTEPSSQYSRSTSLPVKSPATYLLLVDSRVSNYKDIINAKQPGVYHIVFDAAARPTHSAKLIKDIEDQIAALGVPAFTSIGLVQHNDGRPIYEMFGRISDRLKPVISGVATRDPDIESWNRISLFITMLRLNYGIVNFDMMACALYSDPNWKYVIDKLTAVTGVTVRASTDDTGAASLGGDWFLESHTGANLKEIYFTEAIENYTGVLYTAPSSQSASVPPGATTSKKLILIDNRIKDINVIINAMNEDTYCLVFNYFYDTPASILSKLRFLTGNNRYILDNFHYEPPTLPTRMDASGNHCTPCDDFDMNDIQLVPGILENEYLEYTMSGGDASGNGGVWPFYSESTNITIQKPVFFQRAKIGETTESVPHGSTDGTVVAATETIVLNYKPRPMVLVSDLDAFYELGQNVGEIGSVPVVFDCVGIIQHTIDPTIGYKFISGSDDTVAHAIVQDVVSRDSSLSSWAPFTAFIQAMKTAHQMTILDMMACALYANPDWKYVIDTLAVRENITIRASLDNTGWGSSEEEANWVLETNDVSLTTVYFTDKIYEWKYVLATYIDTRFNALRWNDSMYATRGYDSRLKIAAGTANFTIEAWYYETTSRMNCTLVDMGDYNYTFLLRNGNLSNPQGMSLYNHSLGNWLYAESAVVPVAQWSHVAISRSGSTFTFYINGIARQTFTNSASLYSNNSTFAISLQSPDTCLCNRMKVDNVLYDIRLWNVARSATDILMFRNRVVPANTAGLVANYLCTDNTGSLNDRTPNALHTTIQNYDSSRWSNNTIPIPNIGFLINNGYSLRTTTSGSALNAFTHFDNITYTDFSGVDLSGVNFRGADLTGCNFTNANLTNTNFENAYMISVTTTNAITTGSNITDAITNLTSRVLRFDGVDDSISAGVPSWSNSTQIRRTMTAECWFKTADTNPQKGVAGFVAQYGITPQYRLHMASTGQLDLWLATTSGWDMARTSLSYNDALWHHFAATYNSSNGAMILYVDGVSVLSKTHSAPGEMISITNNTPIIIGSDYDGTYGGQSDRQFRGFLSDIRIWNVVRTPTEIFENYRRRLVGNEAGLLGYWKLNQGHGSGWTLYSTALDSTVYRTHGTLLNMGATPSGNWAINNLNFRPRISTLTLGPNNGVYNSDSSFSFIDPSSNSLGDFTYAVTPSTVASVSNGAATTKTIFATSGAISIPTLTLFEFPEIASLSSWQIDVSFTVTGGAGTWRALVGDMYNNVSTGRGWGLWVSANNPSRIHWSWMGTIAEPATITVDLNTAYVLTAAQSSGTITLTLRTVSSGVIQSGSFSVGANVIGKGPVTIGGWQNYSGENFPGTISYVNVSVPTNQRVVTLASSTDGTPATVTATQASLLDYSNGSRTASLTVNKAPPTFSTTFANVTRTNYQSFSLTSPVSNSTGAFSFTSSNTAVATINPAVTINALQFNGTSNFVDFGANIVELGKSSFTIEFWVKTNGTRMGMLNCQDSDSTWETGEKSLYIDADGIPVFVGFGCNFIYATDAVNDNTWHHIAVTWLYTGGTSGTPTFYIDGINRTGTTHPFYSIYPQYTANTFNLGTFVFGKPTNQESVNFFNGAVCELRIWNVARSATDIFQNYRRMLVGNETGLLAYHRFNQGIAGGTNTSITTVSNNLQTGGYTGTLGGSFTLTGSSSNWVTGISIRPENDVTVVTNGTTTITATQEATNKYQSLSTTATLSVSIPTPTIGVLTIPSKTNGDSAFILTPPTSNSDGSFSYTSSNTSVAIISNPRNALHFDGVNDAVNVDIPSWTYSTQFRSSMTVECWFKTSDTNNQTSSAALVSRYSGGGNASTAQFLLGVAGSANVTFVVTNDAGTWYQISSPATYKDMLWHHAAATYNSSTGVSSLYVDGVLVNRGTNANYGLLSNNSSLRLVLGSDHAGIAPSNQTDRQFRGSLSDVRIWNVVRSSTEIFNNYAIQLQGNESGLVFYNKLDQGIANGSNSGITTTTNNLVSGGNSGTLLNFTLSGSTSNWVSGPEPRITILSGGSTTITATQAATNTYTSGTVSAVFVVSGVAPTIGAFTIADVSFGVAPFSLTPPSSNSNGAFVYSNSTNTSVATVTSGGVVTVVGVGTTTITATQDASGIYSGGSSVTGTLTVRPVAPTIGSFVIADVSFGDASFNLTNPTSNSTGLFSYVSSNTNVATVTKITFTTTSLLARYDTSQPSNYTLSGTTVTQWNDLTGNGYHLTQNGTGPTLTTINSITAFDFNSSRGFIRASVPLSSTITVFMVIKYSTNIGSWGSFMHHGNRDTDWAIERNSWPTALTSHNLQFQSNNVNGPPELSTSNNVNYILIGRINGSTREFWRYSDTQALGFTTGTTVSIVTGNKTVYVGKSDNNEACNSTIGEILYYNSTLSNADVSANLNYLQNKWFNNLDTPSFLTIIGAGSSTITATQDAATNYTTGSVTASLVVSPIAPTIGALSMPAKNFGDASFNLTAPTSNSSGAFSYTSSNTSVATVTSSGRLTVVGAGSTTITATQDASGNYTTGSVTASLVVSPIAPTIGALSMSAKNFGDASFNLTAPTSNSTGAFSYTSSNTSVATVTSGGTVTVIGAGSTTITATQDASGNYTTGSVTASLVVSPVAPTFGTFTIPQKFINDISFTLTSPSSNSNGTFTFSTDASGSAIATVTSGGIVSLTGLAGTAIITVTQAASDNGNYTSRSVTASLVVNAALSNFTVPSNKVYADAPFDLTDPITIYSGEPFIFTSSHTTVASIGGAGGRTVTIHKAGSTTITAKQVATGAHPELTITAVLVIAKKTTVITLSAITKNYGDASFNISPSSSNTDTLTPTFSITSRNPDIISIFDASYAAIRGVGSVLIDISQSETTNFTTATATIMITVNKGNPVLSAFTVSTTRTYSSTPFSAVAYPTSVSNGAIVYSSSDSTVATIDSSGIITLLKAGYVNFTATQQATAYYNSNTKTTNTMTVVRQALALVRSSPTASTINKTYGDGYFNVIATNDSNGGTITYETNNPSVAGIVGSATAGLISVVSAGTATITARRGQTDQYTSDPISWTVEVARTTTTLSGLSDLSYNVTAAPFTVTASSASNGAITYSLQDPSSQVLTIHPTSGLVTLRSPGSAVIVASQAQGTNYFAPASITATITVSSAGNALQGATITSTASFAAVNLEGASLAGVSITNTAFTAAKLTNANLTNAVIVSANFASADLSGATLAGATITGATFTAASLKNADLSGAVLTNTAFTGSDLSGAKLTGVDASGASFANAKLNNVDLTGANIANVNFTNTSIKGAIIDDISFSPLQKLQLLKNSENRDIGQIIIPEVTGTTVLAAISETSPLRAIQNLDLATATVAVVVPTTSTSPSDVLPDVVLNVANSDKFYLPINESEFFQIEGVKYYATGGVVRNYLTNAVVEVISYNGTPVWLLAGSIVGLVLQTNTLNSSQFVIPSRKLITDTSPFMPTTLPTSNNTETPIVYSSSNTNIATINSSSGEITVTGNFTGFVHFTATQVQNATYEPGTSVSNTLFVDRAINFSLSGLNQTFNLSTLVTLDASSISVDATDATAIFYLRLSDMNNIFMYQSDATDITNVSADDMKYYVFHRKWPTELKLNPTHAMMNKTESAGMLGIGDGYTNDKSLAKHDFIRYIALRLFNTIHAVDLFHNETELHENSVFLGETVRNNIDTILSGISTTSSSGTMSYDASGNKYLTNDASGNTNLCREIMRHIAAVAPSRFYGNVPNHAGLKNVPFIENDSLQYKLVVQAAASQNMLTGVSVIPSRSYTIKLVLKNTVNTNTNANSVISDSIMYPNSYPYSSSVVTYPPTSDSSGVYNLYSPPAPIPFARFGYNGWYYTNSTTWVNVAPAVRNHIKWLVGGNTATSKVGDLQYVRINIKIHNTTSLPYVMIYTQAGSSRKYAVVSGNGSLTNGTVYSFYMNFNSYAREPAYIGYTNAALGYTIGTGSFANNETITSIALESDSNAAASNVEFTLSSIVIGELSTTTNLTSEKEYGFEAAVPEAYP